MFNDNNYFQNNGYVPNSARTTLEIDDQIKKMQENQEKKEFNNPTNQYLRKMLEQNDNLKKQLDYALKNVEDAKRDTKYNKIVSFISILIAFASMVISIIAMFIS